MKSIVLAYALALVGSPLTIYAASSGGSPDASFYKEAAQGGLAEVAQGELAQQKGQSTDVKGFGQKMVQDHSAANDQLGALARTKGIDLPTSPSVGQKAMLEKLKLLSGDRFDESYIEAMVQDHKDDIAAFAKEAQNGQDPEARQFAQSTLPTLKMHLSMIQSIAAKAHLPTG